MKKLLLFILFAATFTYGQVTTSPSIPTINNEITVIFNATGSPLENYTGLIYAHTGATVNGADWQNVIGSWGENTVQPELINTSGNLYEFVISPDIHTYYGIDTANIVSQLNFVFRSADGNSQSSDIFIPIYEDGLNVVITNPNNSDVFNLNDAINISADVSTNSDLEILVNDVSQNTALNTTTITTPYSFTSTGNHIIKVIATQGTETSEKEILVYVTSPTVNESIPNNISNGFNDNNDGTVSFVLLAPDKNDVFIIGEFNNWQFDENYQMKKDGDYFWITVSGLDADTEYTYQYYIDYTIKIADPYAEKILDPNNDQYIPNSTYPNLIDYPTEKTSGNVSTFKINDSDYVWQNTSFTKPNKENLIIYELLLRDFTDTDTYQDAISHLDYLEKLGVNAIELMPVNEFEGNDSWGYNPSFYMALDKTYGTKNDLKEFIDECHQRGIAVLADIVFNHSFSQSPLLQMYWDSTTNRPAANSPFYNTGHNLVDNTSAHWGYDFNHESPYTVNFFNNVLSYWMNEYKMDGFRFDFTKGLSNTIYTGANNWASAYDADRIENLKAFADHVWANDPGNEAYVIFEHLSDNDEEKELADYGIMLWGNMNHSYNQNTMGYSSDTDISWISYKNRGWNNPNVVGYMESHDEERMMFRNLQNGNSDGSYDVKDLNTALSRQELAGVFLFAIPGPKMIWQFGELGYDHSIDENGRTGRKPVKWEYYDDANRRQIYNTWSTLIEFKKQQPVFNTTDFTLDVAGLTKSILLKHATMDVVLVGNFDLEEKTITTEFSQTGVWHEYFTGEEKNIASTSETITLNPGEYRLFSTQKLLDPRGGTALDDSDNDGIVDTEDLCPNTPFGKTVNTSGCEIFTLPETNFEVFTTSVTCKGVDNGKITVNIEELLDYNVTVIGNSVNVSDSFNDLNWTIENLKPGEYEVCFTVSGKAGYEQCFTLIITEPEDLAVASRLDNSGRKVNLNLHGGDVYFITLNDITQETSEENVELSLKSGLNTISISTGIDCQGKFEKTIFLSDEISYYPNPTTDKVFFLFDLKDNNLAIDIFSMDGRLVKSFKKLVNGNHEAFININNLKAGNYLITIKGHYTNKTFKIVKQ